MFEITLVGTRHAEFGRCNSGELYHIIETIDPEIIFEEIPPSFFDQYYLKMIRSNLESDAINKYLEMHDVKHVPVDSDDLPDEQFLREHERMSKRVEGHAGRNGFNYRDFVDRSRNNIFEYGFPYLNSPLSEWINDEIQDATDKTLQEIDDANLYQINELWKEVHHKRENEMLDNIYKYSQENKYNRAIFTVGFAHRKSIKQKIAKREESNGIKLSWKFFGD